MSFRCFEFIKKTNKNNSSWEYHSSKSNFFVHYFGELKTPKRHFKINWPLAIPVHRTIHGRLYKWICTWIRHMQLNNLKDISKLTDLYRCPVRYDFRVVRKLLGWLINFPTRDDGTIVWLQRNLSIILLYRCMRDVLDKYTQHTCVRESRA